MYLTRTLESWFKEVSRQFPVLLVTGARQVGKTTFLRHASEPERTYVTLDDPLVLALAKSDPALFMQRFPPPVLIDEIQYAPELLPYIKMACEQHRTPNLFWLTGSQQFQMMRGVSESLAGRVGVLQLLGFSRRELLGMWETSKPFLPLPESNDTISPLDVMELYRLIWRGSFPAIALSEQGDRAWNGGRSYLFIY